MAKVIRSPWVYRKPYNHWYRYLPRRNDNFKEFDYEAQNATPEKFPDPMPGPAPKLWVAWLYRNLTNEPKWTKERVWKLFGKDVQAGDMQIFKNTASLNNELWYIKHLIELRPMTFPNGEPTTDDVYRVEVQSDGQCVIHPESSENDLKEYQYVNTSKQFTPNYLRWRNNIRDWQCKDVYEDNVYNPANISIVD